MTHLGHMYAYGMGRSCAVGGKVHPKERNHGPNPLGQYTGIVPPQGSQAAVNHWYGTAEQASWTHGIRKGQQYPVGVLPTKPTCALLLYYPN
eukprot:gene7538-687_t